MPMIDVYAVAGMFAMTKNRNGTSRRSFLSQVASSFLAASCRRDGYLLEARCRS